MTAEETSVLPLLHRLHNPSETVAALATEIERVTGRWAMPEIVKTLDAITLSRGALAQLLLAAYREGSQHPDRKAKLEASIQEFAAAAAATGARCVCGAELRGDTCTRDPSPPRCARCQHALSHGTCPQCEPLAWLQSTRECVSLVYQPGTRRRGRQPWARVVTSIDSCGIHGVFLRAGEEHKLPIGLLVMEVSPHGRQSQVYLHRVNASGELQATAGPWIWERDWSAIREAIQEALA